MFGLWRRCLKTIEFRLVFKNFFTGFSCNWLRNNIPLNPAPRNPLIADLLQSCEYGDKVGSGVKKILKAMEEIKRKPPVFDDRDGRAKVILWGKSALADDLISKFKLDNNQIKAIEIVLSQGFIQTGQFAELLKSSRPKARDELDKLVRLRILTKRGAGRSSKYVLAKQLGLSI
jgi:predicted HTH transcriptional regulator